MAGRDILHSWGKFVFTGIGLVLLIGVTLTMTGVYRGMVDDAKALLDNSGADIWVVQKDTLGPYAESSSLNDDTYRTILAMPGIAQAVIRILEQMASQYDTAIIVVTHDEKIIPTFKWIYHIRDGVTYEEAGEGRNSD